MKILVLFDIDGTILKLKDDLSRILFKKILKKIFGREIDNEHLPDFSGVTDLFIIKEIARRTEFPFEILEKEFNAIWENLHSDFEIHVNNENIRIMPGIPELLASLHTDNSICLGLLTGNFKQNAYLKLRHCDFEKYFKFGSYGCDNEDRNMLPDIAIKRANEFYGKDLFNFENTIIIGDSPNDIRCARANCIPVISVATGHFTSLILKEYNPDYLFEDLSDTSNIIKTIHKHFNSELYEKNNNSN